jgi:glycine dehydrogenase subunit 1
MNYTSHSDADRKAMLEAIGIDSIDALISRVIPEKFRSTRPLNLPEGAREYDLVQEFKALAGLNTAASEGVSFLGGGVYDHYIPAAISHLAGRSEFYTAYTPYQAEVSQGTLQTIYEFQTMVCRLTGMDAANASHYDGATALAEGAILAVRKTGRKTVVVPAGLNPNYLEVLTSYLTPIGVEVKSLKDADGRISLAELETQIVDAAALIIQQPNFFGLLEQAAEASEIAHKAGALVISSTYPISLGMLKAPGDWGADIATAEGQPFGVPMSLGGPYVGLFAVKKDLVRVMPGRIVARAKDKNDKDGYVLTLQTREQHIRREKATSNICTNQALIALCATIYLSLVGRDGLRRAAGNSYQGAQYLEAGLKSIPGVGRLHSGHYFSELAIGLPISGKLAQERLANEGVFAGPALGTWFPQYENGLLLAVTEKRSKSDLDKLVACVKKVVK